MIVNKKADRRGSAMGTKKRNPVGAASLQIIIHVSGYSLIAKIHVSGFKPYYSSGVIYTGTINVSPSFCKSLV